MPINQTNNRLKFNLFVYIKYMGSRCSLEKLPHESNEEYSERKNQIKKERAEEKDRRMIIARQKYNERSEKIKIQLNHIENPKKD